MTDTDSNKAKDMKLTHVAGTLLIEAHAAFLNGAGLASGEARTTIACVDRTGQLVAIPEALARVAQSTQTTGNPDGNGASA